ncbi:MAG: hypothetical protein IT303_09505 [Dehalococcoidia bacterium]|nr:hypothetical protein [Dehalococcoidia bacterium]
MRRWFMFGALAAVLPFALVACGDDEDADELQNDIEDAATDAADQLDDAADAAGDTAGDAASAVAGVAPVQVDLSEQGGSGVSGDAIVTPEGTNRSRVTFTVDIERDAESGEYRAGIWMTDCETMTGEPEHDLGTIDDGQSTEAVGAGIDDLKDGYVLAIMDGDTIAACGTI